MATFDISTLKAQDTADINITHPETGEDLPGVFVTVYGQDSETYITARRRLQAAQTEYKMKHRGKDMPAAQSDELYKQLIISATKSVTGLAFEGKDVTDPATAYNLPGCNWLFEQVAVEMNNRSNFIKGLSVK